jgi:hypothetical protein
MAFTIFTSQTPTSTDIDTVEGQPGVTLGTLWQSDHEGVVRSVRFYLGNRNYDTAAIAAGIFDYDDGTLLSQQAYTITSADAIGFVDIPLDTEVLIQRQKRYITAVWFPCDTSPDGKSHYVYSSGFFASAGVDNPPLHALPVDFILARQNGLYDYGAALACPTNSFNQPCYFIDVTFDYAARMPVLNQTTGRYEQKIVKRRTGGQWHY